MSQIVRLRAHAKVNLTLDVLGLRADGYHDIDSVMTQLELADQIQLTARADGRIAVDTNEPKLACDESNLVYQAAQALVPYCRSARGVDIFIDKRIPMAAGLGGGSADAASVLVGLNQLWSLQLEDDELAAIGAHLGSDVPFCVYGGCARVRGRGERVERIWHRPRGWVVLARPPQSQLFSGDIYRCFDEMAAKRPAAPYTPGMLEALAQGDGRLLASRMGNHLEPAVMEAEPVIIDIRRIIMARDQSWGVCVSGSGPTVVALVSDRQAGATLVQQLMAAGVAQGLLTRFKE